MFFNAAGSSVLIWTDASHSMLGPISSPTEMQIVHESQGVTVHTGSNWTGDIQDYSLVYFLFAPFADPPWWAELISGDWMGRVYLATAPGLSSEYVPSVSYVNSKFGLTGLTLDTAAPNNNFFSPGPGSSEADAIMNLELQVDFIGGFSMIGSDSVVRVTGGTPLSLSDPDSYYTQASHTPVGAVPWLARNTVGPIDWIVAGEQTHVRNAVNPTTLGPAAAALNHQMFRNLYTG